MKKNVYTRRDSATAFLRKNGIPNTDYKDYILPKGKNFYVWVDKDSGEPIPYERATLKSVDAEIPVPAEVKEELERRAEEKPVQVERRAGVVEAAKIQQATAEILKETVETLKGGQRLRLKNNVYTSKVEPVEPTKIDTKRTVSSVARQLIKEGKTNDEIWVLIKKEFKLTDNKKHYPAWYRAEQARKAK